MFTKAQQLTDNRKKLKPKKQKKRYYIKPKPRKAKSYDILDSNYKEWLRANKGCVVYGGISEANHIHHIEGRKFGTNDYLTVPINGKYHNLSKLSYHQMGQHSFKDYYFPYLDTDIKTYFTTLAMQYLQEYIDLGNEVDSRAYELLQKYSYLK